MAKNDEIITLAKDAMRSIIKAARSPIVTRRGAGIIRKFDEQVDKLTAKPKKKVEDSGE